MLAVVLAVTGSVAPEPDGGDGAAGAVSAAWDAGLDTLHASGATGAGGRVSVIDSAVSLSHADVDRVWPNACGGDAVTDDVTAARHTTGVVSIIRAIAPDAAIDVHPVGRNTANGEINCDGDRSALVARALDDSDGAGVAVITSTVHRSADLEGAVARATARGMAVVVSWSGPDDGWGVTSIPGVVTVGAVDSAGRTADWCACGGGTRAQGVDMPVPGHRWWTPILEDGTSWAAPVVAGVVAAVGGGEVTAAALAGRVVTPTAGLLVGRAQVGHGGERGLPDG